MTQQARREYAEAVRARYRGAPKHEKGRILDEYCRTTGDHRKAAIRRLGRAPRPRGRRRGRPRTYGPELFAIVEHLWEVSERLCGKLLAPVLPVLVTALEHGGLALPPPQRQHLLGLSAATLDRLLRRARRRLGRQPRGAPPARATLRSQVPIRTWGEWADVRPGALQGDLVLHCGDRTEGFFLTTLLGVDVASGWTELEAIWGLGQQRVGTGVHHLRQRLPVPLREWHTDNGGEFLNRGLLAWCRREGIRVTRGRGHRTNDQAYAEQRNWRAVRRLVGYDRYSSRAAYAVLQRLYGLLRLQLNFFRPLRKLVSKQRVGSTVRKRYDAAQTPYQRLLAAGVLSAAQRQALERQFLAIHPIALSQQIHQTLATLWTLRESHPARQEAKLG